ncbi:MAG: GntR family transcriptional regulator [Verrucomicrobiales bacterium]|nr:GntR family transcriptional regulator [Verrucomicrobiales bacterium]
MSVIGKTSRLMIVRDSDQGFYLDAGPKIGEILLPTRYIPDLAEEDPEQGDEVEVFVYRDSEDRPIATTEKPIAEVGQYALFEVVDTRKNTGAFLDWGLPKDLLLPYREQATPVRVGEKIVARVTIDQRSERIMATTKMNRYLNDSAPMVAEGQKVSLLVYGKTDLGIQTVVNDQYAGLIFHSDAAEKEFQLGDQLEGYVRHVRPDGRLDISLEQPGYGRVTDLTTRILEALEAGGGQLDLGDKSSPEAIRERFGTSKKAFKQAVGALYRQRKIQIEPECIRLS